MYSFITRAFQLQWIPKNEKSKANWQSIKVSGPERKLVVSIVIFQVAALPKNGNVEIEAIAQIGKKILYSFYTLNFSVYNIKIWKIRNYILHFSIILNFYIYIFFLLHITV